MNYKKILITIVSIMVCVAFCDAKPRDLRQMQQLAQAAIASSGRAFAPAKGANKPLKIVESRENLSLIGYEGGAYAVVSNDDQLPEVMGVSSTPYSNGRNKNFEWWLATMDKALKEAKSKGIALKVTPPNPSKYPVKVDPLVTTKWDQTEPYNGYLPEGIYTGCVATAMAQVLNYHKTPVHGIGTSSVTVNTYVYTNYKVTATFGEDYYDWDNMLDEYTEGEYNAAQKNAVALLMRDCGVAANMIYGGDYEEGSGAYLSDAAEGLRKYFGLEHIEYLVRDNFSESAWMNRIYKEISSRGPIVYGGADLSLWAGHAFVLHGYREDGKVYVNWGWSGEDDGWFDVATLAMPGYSFSAQQDMIVGIESNDRELSELELTITQPGSLSEMLPEDADSKLGKLTITGDINSSDLRRLRSLAGVDHQQNRTDGVLQTIDLRNARIVSGGEPYLIDNDTEFTTVENEIPERAFYGCISLREIYLPTTITSIGNGALAGIPGITKIELKANDNQTFTFDDNFIYADASQKTITNVIQTTSDELIMNDEIEEIAPYALAGTRISSLRFGKNLSRLDNYALANCNRLREIRITSGTIIPVVSPNTLYGINYTDCKLYVPSGMKETYSNAEGWKNFKGLINYNVYDNIIEYGTLITVRNAIREYGDENPTFGYVISGDTPAGIPMLSCDATPSSSVGEYIIEIDRGTLQGEFIELKAGTLYVEPAPLTVELDKEYTRYVGEANPDFQLSFSGFKLDDDEEAIVVKPSIRTDADENSPKGDYVVYIEGGETNGNYEFVYVNGSLKVVDAPDAITEIDAETTNNQVYTIDGRRVENTQNNQRFANLKKGVYIVGGKKIVVK